jgi:hypothetical protein
MQAAVMWAIAKKIGLSVCLAGLPVTAWADAIDGHWCHKDGRRFSIRGPEIITPGGKTMEGDYSRHWFSYVVPVPEPGAGEIIFMTLLNENTVQTRLGETASAQEVWIRCTPSISAINAVRSPS